MWSRMPMIAASVLDDSITDSIHASKLGPIIRMTSASAIAATVAGSGSKVCASPFAGTIEVTSACSPPTRAAQSARIENEATTRSELPWAAAPRVRVAHGRSEEHTSELQSRENLVCRLLLEKKKA